MKYLGRINRRGVLGGDSIASLLEIECYEQKGGHITASGEIEACDSALALFHGGAKVAFVTADGHALSLALADTKTMPDGAVAQVVATGDLPVMKNGLLGWSEPAPRSAATKAPAAL
ncbi:hypothetical protein [Hansschlegelia beijingensis]|uniref:Uncharacterized protein n=1 Tax=Hansschlegelia beijingensis TaxID=1133344 RepID=A0A7W6GG22_9HYPH|nr:hypothetical protein [Hansschlegelia beijingensis]MBB3973925.1 hypothetical protein [Hansschlegelia beijingensis]